MSMGARQPESLDDVDGLLVYSDRLQAQGDPRGELIALQHAIAKAGKRVPARLRQAEADLLRSRRADFLGQELLGVTYDGRRSRNMMLRWHLGHVEAAELSGAPAVVLRSLLRAPSARLLRELVLRENLNYGSLVHVLSAASPRTLARLTIGQRWEQGRGRIDVAPLLRNLPRLKRLVVLIGTGSSRVKEQGREAAMAWWSTGEGARGEGLEPDVVILIDQDNEDPA